VNMVANTCTPNYLGGWDEEDCSLRPAQTNSSQDPITKITRAKWTGGVALRSVNTWVQNPVPPPTKKQSECDQNVLCVCVIITWNPTLHD
jgi:hypothetical protein